MTLGSMELMGQVGETPKTNSPSSRAASSTCRAKKAISYQFSHGTSALKNFMPPVGVMVQGLAPAMLVVQGPLGVGASRSSPPEGQLKVSWEPFQVLLKTKLAKRTTCWRLALLAW